MTYIVASFIYLNVAVRSPECKHCFATIVNVHPGNGADITGCWCKDFLNHFTRQQVPYNYATIIAYPALSTGQVRERLRLITSTKEQCSMPTHSQYIDCLSVARESIFARKLLSHQRKYNITKVEGLTSMIEY
jgi:hypothetical protein